MGWVNIAAIPNKKEWQFTTTIDVSVEWVRLRHTINDPSLVYGHIAQVDGMTDFYGVRRIYPYDAGVYRIIPPPMFASRRLAVRMTKPQYTQLLWMVKVDIYIP